MSYRRLKVAYDVNIINVLAKSVSVFKGGIGCDYNNTTRYCTIICMHKVGFQMQYRVNESNIITLNSRRNSQ